MITLYCSLGRFQSSPWLYGVSPRWDISFLPTYVLFWPGPSGKSEGGTKGWHRWTGKGANPYDAWLRHASDGWILTLILFGGPGKRSTEVEEKFTEGKVRYSSLVLLVPPGYNS